LSTGQVIAAVVAVLLAAGAVWRRRQLGGERFLIALVAAAALGIYATDLLSALPDPKKLIGDVATALGGWTYALVGALAFLETGAFVGLVAPGETVIIAGGVIAGQGEISLIPLIGLVWVCAILGDTTSFFIGRRLGRDFLLRHGPKVKITEARLQQVERYFHRHGGKTILIGRFIGLVRALAPFIAGSSRLAYRRFISYSIVGTGLWATTFCVLGYIFWRSFDRVAHVAGQAVFAFGVVVGTIVAVVLAYRQLRDPAKRRLLREWFLRQERKPVIGPPFRLAHGIWRRLLRPVVRAVAPQVRFLWGRLTPGELGLELTTALAVGGVGIYVFVLYAVILAGDPGPTPLDVELLDLADRLRHEAPVDAAKLISDLGALPTTVALVVAASGLLAVQRRFAAMIALMAGSALVYAAVHVAKDAIDRPRPASPLVDTSLSSYPSGHAAYSAAWVAVAVVLAGRLGRTRHGALVLGAIAISAAVGLSRVYLRTHYWSDVAGGWGIGFGIFGALAVITLIVVYVRENGREDAAGRSAPAARR
jgi:membrane protein DedA with SNARE-associated domain/membrane-associated phospholipid phosphatase